EMSGEQFPIRECAHRPAGCPELVWGVALPKPFSAPPTWLERPACSRRGFPVPEAEGADNLRHVGVQVKLHVRGRLELSGPLQPLYASPHLFPRDANRSRTITMRGVVSMTYVALRSSFLPSVPSS